MQTEELESVKLSNDLTGGQSLGTRLGSDEFLYDLIGINITGLKSLGILITSPKEYFDAALSPDWFGKYWPSMRLWFGMMTLMIGLQFLWASENSEFTALFRTLIDAIIQGTEQGAAGDGVVLDFSDFDRVEAGKTTFKNWIFIYPFFFVAFMCALGFIFRGWERPLPYVARVRFIFAIIVPGTIIGLFSTLLMIPLRGSAYQLASFASLGAIFLVYCITAYRGAYAHCDKGTRFGMSFVASLLILITLFLAQITSMLIAMAPAAADIVAFIKDQRPPQL